MTAHIDATSKAEILEALQREREYLLSRKMYGAEHILVKHAINVIDDMESATTAKGEVVEERGCPPGYNGGFCADYDVDCETCWRKWKADELIKELRSQRDVSPQEERETGTWKLAFTEDENVYECSKCGKYWMLNYGDPYDNEMNFCPRCGTPMVASQKTCGDCYWYSDITVHVCEREKEPTSADQAACPMFEPKEEATPRHLDVQDRVEVVRCKDCINHRQSGLCDGWSRYGTINTPDDAFCSYGRKVNNV